MAMLLAPTEDARRRLGADEQQQIMARFLVQLAGLFYGVNALQEVSNRTFYFVNPNGEWDSIEKAAHPLYAELRQIAMKYCCHAEGVIGYAKWWVLRDPRDDETLLYCGPIVLDAKTDYAQWHEMKQRRNQRLLRGVPLD